MTSPAFQFYVKQWLGDDKVMLMDWDARGMHLHYMCIAWQMQPPCTLPDDDEILQKWVGNPSDWCRLKKQIFRAWSLENGLWTQEGLLREYLKQKNFSESRRRNAEEGWSKRRVKAHPKQVHSKCYALQSSTTDNNPIVLFDKFYQAYPRHVGISAAEKAWVRLSPDETLFTAILKAVEFQKNTIWKDKEQQYIPHPATWLNGKRWEDEVKGQANALSGYKFFHEQKEDV